MLQDLPLTGRNPACTRYSYITGLDPNWRPSGVAVLRKLVFRVIVDSNFSQPSMFKDYNDDERPENNRTADDNSDSDSGWASEKEPTPTLDYIHKSREALAAPPHLPRPMSPDNGHGPAYLPEPENDADAQECNCGGFSCR